MTVALAIFCIANVMVAISLTVRHHADRVIDEVHAAELRQIEREQAAGLNANAQIVRWRG